MDAKSGKTFDTFTPHDGSVIAKVSEGGKVRFLLLYTFIRYEKCPTSIKQITEQTLRN